MLNIAICEDNDIDRQKLVDLVNEYFSLSKMDIVLELHKLGQTLVESAKKKNFDIIFLDIMLGDINGMTVAEKIRLTDKKTCIIFVSSSREFAVDGYSVTALGYIVKPVTSDKFSAVVDKYIQALNDKSSRSIFVRHKGVNINIPVDRIIFVESQDKKLRYHLKDASVLETYGKLDECHAMLSQYNNMLRCHKSFLINMNYVKKIVNNKFLVETGRLIPIPRDSIVAKKKAFYDYILDNKQ